MEGGRGGGGRVEKEVESSTTRVGATLEGLEKPLKEEREEGPESTLLTIVIIGSYSLK